MDSSSPWTSMNSAYFHNSINVNFFPQSISAYFRRPNVPKIRKSSSRNQSPRTGGRRRMTTQIPTRTRSVIDHQRSVNNNYNVNYQRTTTRPISWHPNFVKEFEQYQPVEQYHAQQYLDVAPSTNFSYGLITPNTSIIGDEQQSECPEMSLDQMSVQDVCFSQQQELLNVPPDMMMYSDDFSSYTPLSTLPLETTEYEMNNMMWPPLPPPVPQSAATAPASPDFLPIPDLGQPFTNEESEDKDELVGMGLYDSPAQVQSASLLFGGSLPVRRKSLKLEEAFEPAPPENEDDDAEADPGLADDEGEEDEEKGEYQMDAEEDCDSVLDQAQCVLAPTQVLVYEHCHLDMQNHAALEMPASNYVVDSGMDGNTQRSQYWL